MARVLVVEDHADTRELFCQLLADLGYVVCGVESAARGLEELATRAYDAAVVDYWLEDTTRTGSWLLTEARAMGITTPALMCTAEREVPGVPAHVKVLKKPVDIGALLDELARMTSDLPVSRPPLAAAEPRIELRLYITASAASLRGLRNLHAFLRRFPPARFTLKVVDITHGQADDGERLAFTPTLLKSAPLPEERFVGDFRDTRALEELFAASGGSAR